MRTFAYVQLRLSRYECNSSARPGWPIHQLLVVRLCGPCHGIEKGCPDLLGDIADPAPTSPTVLSSMGGKDKPQMTGDGVRVPPMAKSA